MANSTVDSLEIKTGPFTPDPESLRRFVCPDWFRDAKFGIWSHWGPQCVPMFGDWYARRLYREGEDQYRHHWRVYGHPSKHGYKDIIPLWKAERFDPHALMDLYVAAGARYFVGQAMHHDNFDNFDSKHQPRWNSVATGPKKDICRLWQKAAQAKGLPFGLSEHLGASFNWFESSKGADKTGPYAGVAYDGIDPAYSDLYYAPAGQLPLEEPDIWRWYTGHEPFHQHWFNRIKDVIDQFQPDLLYSDGGVPFGEYGRSIIAHLYNTSAEKHGANRAVYNQKDTDPAIYTFGVLDIERGQMQEILNHPWQTDTSLGDWYYNVKDTYKTPRHVIETLIDIVSKNGNLLLNVPQLPDGTLDDECTYLLKQLAEWTAVNGEGIYGTRPWRISGEGSATAEGGAFKETSVAWTADDIRFTARGEDTVYAFRMAGARDAPKVAIRSLAAVSARRVAAVRQLGHGPVPHEQTADALIVTGAPASMSAPVGFAINFE